MNFTALGLLLVGAVVAFNGRKLFWLFAGLVGFGIGFAVAGNLSVLRDASPLVRLGAAIVVGVLCGSMATLATRAVAVLIGFLAGVAVGVFVLPVALGLDGPNQVSLAGVVLGVIAAVFVNATFDWAIVVLSALIGGAAVMYGLSDLLGLDNTMVLIGVIAVALAGIVWQARATGLTRRR